MTRVKRGNVARKRRKEVLQLAEGFRGSSSRLFRTAQQQTMKALRYAYRDRQQRKREFASLWISRVNAAARHSGMNYSAERLERAAARRLGDARASWWPTRWAGSGCLPTWAWCASTTAAPACCRRTRACRRNGSPPCCSTAKAICGWRPKACTACRAGWPWTAHTRRQKLPSDTVWSRDPQPRRRLWAGTNRGLAHADAKEWQFCPAPRTARYTPSREDAEGNFWVGGNNAKQAQQCAADARRLAAAIFVPGG